MLVLTIAITGLLPLFHGHWVSAIVEKPPRILVVCSDTSDVMFANSLATYGGFNVTVLYLGQNYHDSRSMLSNLEYLTKFDEIWIPDLNVQWTYGGRLSEGEISTLAKYVAVGGVLVIGMNTYVQSWSRTFERITGTKVVSIERANSPLYIVFNGEKYSYNASYGVLIVNTEDASVIARYSTGAPAITLSKFGRGVAVVMTFNPVKELLDYNPKIIRLYIDVARITLEERTSPPSLSGWEVLKAHIVGLLSNTLFDGAITLLVLELLAYLGWLPFRMIVILTVPFKPLAGRFLKRDPYKSIVEVIKRNGGMEFVELSKLIGMSPRRLRFYVALLVTARELNLVDISPLDEGSLIVIRGEERMGIAAWAFRRYGRLLELIVKERGSKILEVARKSGYPPYDVLRLMRELSRYGIVEVKRAVIDYKVYPTDALERWAEEWQKSSSLTSLQQ